MSASSKMMMYVLYFILYSFLVASALFGEGGVQGFPLGEFACVGFELRTCLCPPYSVPVVYRYQFVEEDGVHAEHLMVRTHGDEQHFGVVLRFPFQGFQQVEPPEGEELALCLAHGFREAAHRDGYPYHFLGFVLHHAHQVLVHQVQVLAHERVYLLVAQGGEAEDGGVGFVQEAEDALTVVAAGHVLVGEFLDFEVEHFLREACHARVFLGYFLGDVDAHLYPIYLLLVAVGFHVAGVVGKVVEGVHRAHAVEVGEEHPFLVEVGDSHRSLYGVHPAFVSPLGDGVE